MLLISTSAFAQTKGKVEVIKDPRIDTLAARRAELNRTLGVETVSGFRVQIFTGTNRKDAYSAQAKFQDEFPDIRTYVIYSDPNFKVRVGDFRTKADAEKLEDDLKKWFNGMFIIQDKINPPKPDTTDE
jgi:hypothetical protein